MLDCAFEQPGDGLQTGMRVSRNDILLALSGAASLSGGAGNDVLFNAYASSDAAAKAVTMSGGAGSDTFALIGTNTDASGSMKTVVADLGTGDTIDLSFLERANASGASTDTSIASTADLGAAANSGTSLAGMTTAGTTLNLKPFVVTSSEADTTTGNVNEVNSHATGGTMTISNATLTKAAAAITAGLHTESAIDFNSTFGHLTDAYVQH